MPLAGTTVGGTRRRPPTGYRCIKPGETIPDGHVLVWARGKGPWTHSNRSAGAGHEWTGEDSIFAAVAVPIVSESPRKSPKRQETSIQAHESQKDKAPLDRVRLLDQIRKYATGISCDRLEVLLCMKHQTASARLRDLAIAGKIVDSGRRETTSTGRKAICWKAVV